MMYILSQEEMSDLVSKDEVIKRDAALAAARTKILSLSGFDCIHTSNGSNYKGYCDECPCSITNHRKRELEPLCWLTKRYSK